MPTDARLSRAVARWGIRLAEPYPDVYSGNLVYRCTLRDGTPAVLKTEPERRGVDEFLTGIEALLLYDGRSVVRVLEVDRDERTVLLERVVPGEPLWRTPIDAALQAAVSVMARLRKAPLSSRPASDCSSSCAPARPRPSSSTEIFTTATC